MSSSSKTNGKRKGAASRTVWTCDVCEVATFDSYEEAIKHEESCTAKPPATDGGKKRPIDQVTLSSDVEHKKKVKSESKKKSLGSSKLGEGNVDSKKRKASDDVPRARAPKKFFTLQDDQALMRGLRKHGSASWSKIQQDAELGLLHFPSGSLRQRTGTKTFKERLEKAEMEEQKPPAKSRTSGGRAETGAKRPEKQKAQGEEQKPAASIPSAVTSQPPDTGSRPDVASGIDIIAQAAAMSAAAKPVPIQPTSSIPLKGMKKPPSAIEAAYAADLAQMKQAENGSEVTSESDLDDSRTLSDGKTAMMVTVLFISIHTFFGMALVEYTLEVVEEYLPVDTTIIVAAAVVVMFLVIRASFALVSRTVAEDRIAMVVIVLFLSIHAFFGVAIVETMLESLEDHLPVNAFLVVVATVVVAFLILRAVFGLVLLLTHQGSHHHIVPRNPINEMLVTLRDVLGLSQSASKQDMLTDMTLRKYLSHPDGYHMAFAPGFFAYFAIFGAMTAIDEGVGGLVPHSENESEEKEEAVKDNKSSTGGLQSVAGASAGAMAAVMLASGIKPRDAAEFASTFKLGSFADFPGIMGFLKGEKFLQIMIEYLRQAGKATPSTPGRSNLHFEDALLPVAVTVFDLFSLKGRILSRGCMAKAARSSACFPGLFQPVPWRDEVEEGEEEEKPASGPEESTDAKKKSGLLPSSLLIDGGVTDGLGLMGLTALLPSTAKKRIVNVVVGDFGFQGPPGPSRMPSSLGAESVVSISIVNTPRCGPWAMSNGPLAVEAARKAMEAALDEPMYQGPGGEGHFILNVDGSQFLP